MIPPITHAENLLFRFLAPDRQAAAPVVVPTPAVETPRTFADLVRLEPRLRLLRNDAAGLQRGDWHGWEQLKRELQRLVGWDAKRPELATSAAYELAIDALLDAWEGRSR